MKELARSRSPVEHYLTPVAEFLKLQKGAWLQEIVESNRLGNKFLTSGRLQSVMSLVHKQTDGGGPWFEGRACGLPASVLKPWRFLYISDFQ